MRKSQLQSLLVVCSLLAAGCQVHAPGVIKRSPPPATIAASAAPVASATYAPLTETPLVVAQVGTAVQLIGKVKLISERGSGLVANNADNVISNNTGNIISEHGSGIVANNGGGLIGKAKLHTLGFGVLQAPAAPTESLLADARIEVLDAAGHILVDKDQKPITAVSDATGSYKLSAVLPAQNLLLRVRLYNGGQLLAMAPGQGGRAASDSLDLDTASSLAASYVLERYVQGKQEVYNRLPASDAHTLLQQVETARAGLAAAPTYQRGALADALDQLRAKTKPLSDELEHIKAILLVGQANLGAGLPATRIALSTPVQVLDDAKGERLLVEGSIGRIRRFVKGDDGTTRLVLFAGAGATSGTDALKELFTTLHSVALGPDGSIFVSENAINRVRRIWPDGHVSLVTGTGDLVQGPVEVKADTTGIAGPGGLAVAADGTLYVCEIAKQNDKPSRLLRVDPGGVIHAESLPHFADGSTDLCGVAVAPDGTLFVAEWYSGSLAMRSADGTWKTLDSGLKLNRTQTHLTIDGDGLFLAESDASRILRYDRTGAKTVVAGNGTPGYDGDGGPATAAQLNQPCSAWRAPEGTIYVADMGNGLVRAIAKDGTITTVAGTQGLTQQGDAQAVAINGPSALTYDDQGRLVIAESGSAQVKRLDGGKVSVVAGSTPGFGGDGGPAKDARFDQITGLGMSHGNLLVLDSGSKVIRQIDPAGRISTLVGNPPDAVTDTSVDLYKPVGLAIGPDGTPYWCDAGHNQVFRLGSDGQPERIAGNLDQKPAYDGDGGPALDAHFYGPVNLTVAPTGEVFVVDAANLCVREIGLDGKISTVAGLGREGSLAAALAGTFTDQKDGAPASQAFLALPSSVLLDKQGRLYIAEAGTANFAGLQSFGGTSISGLPRILARIRRVDLNAPGRPITTIAGPGTKLMADPSGEDALRVPTALVFDAAGDLVIADGGSNQVKVLPAGSF